MPSSSSFRYFQMVYRCGPKVVRSQQQQQKKPPEKYASLSKGLPPGSLGMRGFWNGPCCHHEVLWANSYMPNPKQTTVERAKRLDSFPQKTNGVFHTHSISNEHNALKSKKAHYREWDRQSFIKKKKRIKTSVNLTLKNAREERL